MLISGNPGQQQCLHYLYERLHMLCCRFGASACWHNSLSAEDLEVQDCHAPG